MACGAINHASRRCSPFIHLLPHTIRTYLFSARYTTRYTLTLSINYTLLYVAIVPYQFVYIYSTSELYDPEAGPFDRQLSCGLHAGDVSTKSTNRNLKHFFFTFSSHTEYVKRESIVIMRKNSLLLMEIHACKPWNSK